MTRDEVLNVEGGEPPCLCADGKLGLLTCFPGSDDRCGVQVLGENEHRWMTSADLSDEGGGALVQTGADPKAIFSAVSEPVDRSRAKAARDVVGAAPHAGAP